MSIFWIEVVDKIIGAVLIINALAGVAGMAWYIRSDIRRRHAAIYQRGFNDAASGVKVDTQAELIEKKAREIYDGWKHMPGWVPWVEGGNSHKQGDARRIAADGVAGTEHQTFSRQTPMGSSE